MPSFCKLIRPQNTLAADSITTSTTAIKTTARGGSVRLGFRGLPQGTRWLLHRRASRRPGLLSPPGGREGSLDEVPPPCPSHSQMVPGEEVKDLLLAAGDGGQRLHDGAGRLPGSLCRRSKEHLRGRGEVPGSADSLSSGPARNSQLPCMQGKSSEHLTSKSVKEKSPANSRSGCCRWAKRLSKNHVSMVLLSNKCFGEHTQMTEPGKKTGRYSP